MFWISRSTGKLFWSHQDGKGSKYLNTPKTVKLLAHQNNSSSFSKSVRCQQFETRRGEGNCEPASPAGISCYPPPDRARKGATTTHCSGLVPLIKQPQRVSPPSFPRDVPSPENHLPWRIATTKLSISIWMKTSNTRIWFTVGCVNCAGQMTYVPH